MRDAFATNGAVFDASRRAEDGAQAGGPQPLTGGGHVHEHGEGNLDRRGTHPAVAKHRAPKTHDLALLVDGAHAVLIRVGDEEPNRVAADVDRRVSGHAGHEPSAVCGAPVRHST
jgi:hypothetical protein